MSLRAPIGPRVLAYNLACPGAMCYLNQNRQDSVPSFGPHPSPCSKLVNTCDCNLLLQIIQKMEILRFDRWTKYIGCPPGPHLPKVFACPSNAGWFMMIDAWCVPRYSMLFESELTGFCAFLGGPPLRMQPAGRHNVCDGNISLGSEEHYVSICCETEIRRDTNKPKIPPN